MTERDIQILSMIGNLCTGIGTMLLAIGAIWTLGQWRKQLVYKEQLEIARKIVFLAERFKLEFQSARSPLISLEEAVNRPRHATEMESDKLRYDEAYVRQKMLQIAHGTRLELYALNWEARILLKQDFTDLINKYRNAIIEVASAQAWFFSRDYELARAQYNDRNEVEPKLQEKIYSDGTDELAKKVENAANEVTLQLTKFFE